MRRPPLTDRTFPRSLIVAAFAAAMLAGMAAPAFAHDWRHGSGGDWRRQEWRNNRASRENRWREHALRERSWRALRAHQWRERHGYFRSFPRGAAPNFYVQRYPYPPSVFYGAPSLGFSFFLR